MRRWPYTVLALGIMLGGFATEPIVNAAPTDSSVSRAVDSPEAQLRQFYQWHLQTFFPNPETSGAVAGSWEQHISTMRRYVTPAALTAARRFTEQEGADYFVQAQDMHWRWAELMTITPHAVTGLPPQWTVSFPALDGWEAHTLLLDVVLDHRRWKIVGVTSATPPAAPPDSPPPEPDRDLTREPARPATLPIFLATRSAFIVLFALQGVLLLRCAGVRRRAASSQHCDPELSVFAATVFTVGLSVIVRIGMSGWMGIIMSPVTVLFGIVHGVLTTQWSKAYRPSLPRFIWMNVAWLCFVGAQCDFGDSISGYWVFGVPSQRAEQFGLIWNGMLALAMFVVWLANAARNRALRHEPPATAGERFRT